MKKFDVSQLLKPGVRGLNAYEAKEVPCRVKLDANESPYGFKVPASIRKIPTNRYPDPEAKALRDEIAKGLGLGRPEVLMGNGSDELIYYLIMAFGGPVLSPTPTFSMYGIIARALGERAVGVPLDPSFDIDLPPMLGAIKKNKPKLIFLSSPNNPTGNCFSTEKILKIIERSGGIVVLDEAYVAFSSDKGFISILKDYPNLVILRTLSKVGLAGLRVGFMAADEPIINEVNKVRLPFNLNSFSQAVALSALRDRGTMKKAVSSIVSERERLMDGLSSIGGVEPYPSEANFILFRTKGSDKIYEGLLKRGVLVRDMGGVVEGCLRVTVGTKKENDIFIKALKGVMK